MALIKYFKSQSTAVLSLNVLASLRVSVYGNHHILLTSRTNGQSGFLRIDIQPHRF